MNFSNLSIRLKLILGIIGSVSIAVILSVGILYTQMQNVIEQAELRELRRLFASMEAEIASRATTAETLSALVGEIPEVRKQFADRNRGALADLFVAPFNVLKKQYQFRQFQFHEPNAHSYLRVHKPKKFGDDLSSFRKTVVATNAQKKPIKGIEKGVAGLGIRGIYPISSPTGQHVGSVEFGLSLNKGFFDNFKKKYGVNINLYQLKNNTIKLFAGTTEGVSIDLDQYEQAVSGKEVLISAQQTNTNETALLKPVKDFSGNPIGVAMISQSREYYASQANASIFNALIALAISVGIAAMFAYLMLQIIIRPIKQITESMEEIALGDGDLTSRIKIKRQDEVFALARAFNLFSEKVQSIIKEVTINANDLNKSNQDFVSMIASTQTMSKQQNEEVDSVVAASTEMTSTIAHISDNTQNAATTAEQAMQLTIQSNDAIKTAVASVEKLTKAISQTDEAFNSLERESGQISTVLHEIQEIAEQTNLLALNAAIEAARAGDQGRGFAVVAGEVRTLASRTQQSTESIEQSISNLQNAVNQSASLMKASVEHADTGLDNSQQARDTLDQVHGAISNLKQMNQDIDSATHEQSSTAKLVDESLHSIKNAAEQTLESSESCVENSQKIEQIISSLLKQIGKFKV